MADVVQMLCSLACLQIKAPPQHRHLTLFPGQIEMDFDLFRIVSQLLLIVYGKQTCWAENSYILVVKYSLYTVVSTKRKLFSFDIQIQVAEKQIIFEGI